MYRMMYNDHFLFDPFDNDRIVGDARVTNNINAASYLDFTIYPGHPLYDVIEERSGTVTLWWDHEELFKGQIYKIDIGLEGPKSVACNSALEWLKDIQLRPYSTDLDECNEYEFPLDKAPDSLDQYFQWVIDQYNERAIDGHKFRIDVNQADRLTDNIVYFSNTSAQTVAEAIEQNIIGTYGGYLTLRYQEDELVLDLYSDIHEMNAQIIDFGENILDINKVEDTTEQYTAIRPTGYTPQYTAEQQRYHDEKEVYDQQMEDRDIAQKATIDRLKREEDAEQNRIDGMPSGQAKTNAQNALKRRKENRERQEKAYQEETERLRAAQKIKDDKNSEDKTKPNPITITSLPDGGYSGDLDIYKRGDSIYSVSAVDRYGYKEYSYSESEVEDKNVLLKLAVAKLKALMAPQLTVDVRAIDQATYNPAHTHLFVGQAVRVRSGIQHIDEFMMVSSIELDLNDPSQTTATLGVAYDTLTGQQSSYLKNLNSQIVASIDAVKKVDDNIKTTEIVLGRVENMVVTNKEQHDILVNTVESNQWVSNTAYNNAQEASEAAAKANEDIQEVNTALNEHNAKLEALDESAKAMDGKIKETEEKAQNAVASIETLRTDVETDIQGVRDDVAAVSDKADTIKTEANKAIEEVKESVNAVSDKADTIKTEANKAIEEVKESVNAVSDRAEAINTAANSAIAGVRNEVQNVKTSAENANTKANELQKSLDDANAVIETHTTKLGGLETTLSNTTQTAESALSVASSAKLEAGQVKITANSAYADAQSALTKASELKSDIDGLSLNLSNNYYGKGDADALFATNASLQATSNGIKTEVSKTYATKESVDTLQNIADNAIESWTGTTVPTASNAPANTWTTKELKKRHSGDIYYNMSTGKSYRWGSTDGNTYSWTMIADSDITKAIADAAKAQQTADGAKQDVVNLSNDVKATYTSKSEFKQTSDEIKASVSEVASANETNTEKIADLSVKADGISATVREQAETISGHTTTIGNLSMKADGLQTKFEQVSDDLGHVRGSIPGLINPNFTDGDYGWIHNGASFRISTHDASVNGPYLVGENFSENRDYELINKGLLSLVPGHKYRISILMHVNTKILRNNRLSLRFIKTYSPYVDYPTAITYINTTDITDNQFVTYSREITCPAKVTQGYFRMAALTKPGSDSYISVKSVDIVDITEGSAALTKTSQLEQNLDGFKQTASQIYETKDASSQKIQEVKTSVNGLTSTVSSVSTTANSALEKSTKLEQSVDGFKSEVSQTYATKTELSDELKNTAKSYNITGGLVRWNNVGRIVIPQQGKNAVLDFSYGRGFNGINDQQCSVRVELRTSNRPGTNPEPNRISATITGLLRATHFSMKIYYEGGDTYNLWVRDVGNYTRGTVTVYGVVDFTVIDQMVAEGVNDPTDTGTEQTSIGKQELTNATYVDQTSERIALNSIRNYRDADGNTLVNSGQLAVSANQIKSEVAQTYTTKDEFNNLQIGGRNLLLKTKTSKQVVGNNGGNQYNTLYTLSMQWARLDPGEYMISADISYEGPISGKFIFQRPTKPWALTPNAGKNFSDIITDSKRKAHVEFLVTDPTDGTSPGLGVRFDNVQGTVTFSNMKLEKGNKATTWSPAPEDMVSQTEAETTYTTKSEFTQEKDKITLSVSEAATTANSALSKANALEVTAGNLQSTISEHATSISGNTTNISKLTQTANSLTSELSQVSNIADIAYNKTDNLIIDGGFEGGTKTWPNIARAGWRFTDGTRRTGSYAVRKEVSTTIGTLYLTHKPTECIDTQGSIAGRPLDLIPGRIYRFSCWIYPTNGAAGAPDKCKVRIGAAPNGSHIWSKAFNTFPQNTWTELTFDYTATAENPRIFLNVQCDNTAGIYCFDDFSFRDVTEALEAQKTADSGIEKTSKLEQTLDGFKTTVSQTYLPKTDFDNLKIGGRNLWVWKGFLRQYVGSQGTIEGGNQTVDATMATTVPCAGEKNVIIQSWNLSDKTVSAGNATGRMAFYKADGTFIKLETTISYPNCNYKYSTKTVPIPEEAAYFRASIVYPGGPALAGDPSVFRVKFEFGNKPTDWTPAPEDMVSQTEAETTYTTKSEFTQEKDKITLSVSEAATTANSALSKANTLEQTAGQLQSSISEQAKTISGHTTSINTLTQTATSLSSQITQVGTEAKAAQTTANDAISRYSTLKQDLDGFKTTVGQTYETKTDALNKKSSLETTINSFKTEVSTTYAKQTALTTVSDKLDNLKIGGRNLWVWKGFLRKYVSSQGTIEGTNSPVDATMATTVPCAGEKNIIIQSWNLSDNTVSNGTGRIAFYKADGTFIKFETTVNYQNCNYEYSTKTVPIPSEAAYFRASIVYPGGPELAGDPSIFRVKFEFGNKPTDWTPAPEDMATALELSEQKSYIDQQDSKIELGVKNTYQTKADMAGYAKTADVESKISASKSGILLEVSNKYASKELPQQLIDNLKVGDTNLLQRTQWLDRTGVSASETGYMNVTPASYDSTNYLGKFKVGKVTSSGNVLLQYSIMDVEPNTDYVFSWYGKGTSNINAYFFGPTGYIKAIAVDYSDGMSFVNPAYSDGKISFQMTSEWKRYWVHWKTAETMNGATTKAKYVLLRDDSNVRDAYAAAPKLEKGTKPTEWSPSPWDLGDAQTLREQGTKIEQNANNIALKVSTKDLAFGDNIWPNQWCEPSTADNPRYQIGSPYTGTEAAPSGGKIFQLNSRDHYNGDFPLRMPSRLRIIVEAKRIAGTRNLNAGIWRKQKTEGNAWFYVGVTKRENLTNDWQRLTYDFNNNSCRVGALYFQIDQSGSSPDTTWLISNIRFYDITDSEELNTKIDVRADNITTTITQQVNTINQSINQTNANLNSTNQAVSTINSNVNTVTQNVNTLQTYITQKAEGILVGKNVNGTPTGYVARVNSMGSFDILDSSRNNRVVASMGTDGLEYRKYYDSQYLPADAYSNWTIGFQSIEAAPTASVIIPDMRFPVGTAFNSWPGNGASWNIVRDRFQQPGTVYRSQNIGGNGFCCYDSTYNNTTYGIFSSANVIPQPRVQLVNVNAIREILETKTGSYSGCDYEHLKYYLYTCGAFLSTHNDSSDPNATPTPGSTNFKSVVLMSPGLYLISAIVDIRQPTSGTILGDVWFQWNINGGINDWQPVPGCPIYTALWNGGQDIGGDKPGHWVRATIPATLVNIAIPCVRVALRLPPDIDVGSRTQMTIVRLPFSYSHPIQVF